MRWFPSVAAALARSMLAWPGQASQAQARGDGGKIGYAVVCGNCGRLLGANTHRPRSIHKNCPCGVTTRGNWTLTTQILKGRPCSRCRTHLFFREGSPRRLICGGPEHHDPPPMFSVDLRGR